MNGMEARRGGLWNAEFIQRIAGKHLPETSLNVYTFLLQIVKKLVMKRLYVWGMHPRALRINDDDLVKVGKRA